MILVDTPVWSLALRRREGDLSTHERGFTEVLSELIRERRVQLLGSNRQELLSGIREQSQFRRIRDYLRDFPNVDLDAGDYEEAAQLSHKCRSARIAASPVDMLMCAVSLRYGWEIMTTDRDFTHYLRVLPLKLFSPVKLQ